LPPLPLLQVASPAQREDYYSWCNLEATPLPLTPNMRQHPLPLPLTPLGRGGEGRRGGNLEEEGVKATFPPSCLRILGERQHPLPLQVAKGVGEATPLTPKGRGGGGVRGWGKNNN